MQRFVVISIANTNTNASDDPQTSVLVNVYSLNKYKELECEYSVFVEPKRETNKTLVVYEALHEMVDVIGSSFENTDNQLVLICKDTNTMKSLIKFVGIHDLVKPKWNAYKQRFIREVGEDWKERAKQYLI